MLVKQMLMIRRFIEKCLKHISAENFSLFLYGSSAIDISCGRDIDAIAISPNFDDVYYVKFEINVDEGKKISNLYLVPEFVYFDDVYNLKYGGYYSHKFALTFREILRKEHSLDAPLLFWTAEYNLCRQTEKLNENPDILMKTVHFKILKYRPTFARALGKFIDDKARKQNLRCYLRECVLKPNLLSTCFASDFLDRVIQNQEKAFYNFWSEYNRHKCKTQIWGEKTLSKMKYSLEDINFSLLENYFTIL